MSQFCDDLRAYLDRYSIDDRESPTTVSAADAADGLARARVQFQALAASSPAAIRDELVAMGARDPNTQPDTAMQQRFNRVDEWLIPNCGFSMSQRHATKTTPQQPGVTYPR